MPDNTTDPQTIIDDLRARLGSPPAVGEYSSMLEDWLRAYLAAGGRVTPLLQLPFAWQAPLCECLCGVGDYALSALGVRLTLRCQVEHLDIETGKRAIPAPMRTEADGSWVKGRGIGRTLHLSTGLDQGDEIELDAFYSLAALRRHCASAWHEQLRASSSSLPQADDLVEVAVTVAGGGPKPVVKSAPKKKGG